MQPYFFPYIGYFQLINYVDKWVVLDSVQYIRHGWVNRNRILKPSCTEWQYIHVELKKHSRKTLIKDIQIKDNEIWKKRLFAQLRHYKSKAPFYHQTIMFLKDALTLETDNLSKLNIHLLKKTCAYLNIPFSFEVYSAMNLKHENVTHPSEWALNISKAMNASCYINPIGGVDLFNKDQFKRAKINLKYLQTNLENTPSNQAIFSKELSILDIMMFFSIPEIRSMLLQFNLH